MHRSQKHLSVRRIFFEFYNLTSVHGLWRLPTFVSTDLANVQKTLLKKHWNSTAPSDSSLACDLYVYKISMCTGTYYAYIGIVKNDRRLKVETQLLTAVLRCGYQPYRRRQTEKAARTVPVSYFCPSAGSMIARSNREASEFCICLLLSEYINW